VRCRAAVAVAGLVAVLALAGPAAAQPGAAPRAPQLLATANDALAAGDFAAAVELAGQALADPAAPTDGDRAEANRVLGIASFFLGDRLAAEAALLRYLRLDADAHLDPTLVAPEAIVFFEDVRARHADELAASRPKPRRRRYLWLNLVPMAGQLQNGERGKAWLVGGGTALLVGVNLASFLWLRAHCSTSDGTCSSGPSDPGDPAHRDLTDTARTLRVVNAVAGAAAIGLAVYGIVDGFVVYRRQGREAREKERDLQVGASLGPDGLGVGISGRF
jgi:hypothetical protein